ncbi:MAG: hypothetical protein K9M51_00400 [Candidatus Gracilibacteria bacterium]|nr:hypothetical protein [Candidatus Gracilibacteria bacterium]
MQKIIAALGVGFLFGGVVLADLPAAGVALADTEIQIEFTPEIGGTSWQCPGAVGNTLTTNLISFGMEEGETELEIGIPEGNHCFRQAGEYAVTITPVDAAGNVGDPVMQNFTIKAGDADQDFSTFEKIGDCADGENKIIAAGENAPGNDQLHICEVQLTLRDRFGNLVTQLVGAGGQILAEDVDSSDDENLETSFQDGLFAGGVSLSGGGSFTGINAAAEKVFDITAIAPSLKKADPNSFPETAARDMTFLFTEVPAIDLDGTIGVPDIGLAFDESLEFYLPLSQKVILSKGAEQEAPPQTEILSTVILKDYDPAWWTSAIPVAYQTVFGELYDTNPEEIETGCAFASYAALNDMSQCPLVVNEYPLDEADFEARSRIHYTVDSLGVAYETCRDPGPTETDPVLAYDCGKISCTILEENECQQIAQSVGVDIEGNVQGDPSRNFFLVGDHEMLNIGEVTATDIREDITKNAFKMIRGTTATAAADALTAFDADTNIVVVEGENITLSGTAPTGQNTLIVHNGNLLLENDFMYPNDGATHSFGVILVNDLPEPFPDTGNILVRPGVQEIHGAFYADGGLMTTNGNTPSSWTGEASQLKDQLLLVGSLMSRNTIGGADQSPQLTPWGETASEDQTRKYDLNYMRRYPVGGGDASTNAAPNEASFVLRLDGIATSPLAPPGFSLDEEIRR